MHLSHPVHTAAQFLCWVMATPCDSLSVCVCVSHHIIHGWLAASFRRRHVPQLYPTEALRQHEFPNTLDLLMDQGNVEQNIPIRSLLWRQKRLKLTISSLSHLFLTLNITFHCGRLQEAYYTDKDELKHLVDLVSLCAAVILMRILYENKKTDLITPCSGVKERGLMNGRELHLHHLHVHQKVKPINPCMRIDIPSLFPPAWGLHTCSGPLLSHRDSLCLWFPVLRQLGSLIFHRYNGRFICTAHIVNTLKQTL